MSSTQPIKILMTGAGAPGGPGILHCLQQEPGFEIMVGDANPDASGAHLGVPFIQLPAAKDPAFIDQLLTICREQDIQVLLPLVTRELLPLAKAREQFSAVGTSVMVPSLASLEIANSKSKLYEFLDWRGVPVPEFRIVETVSQFTNAISELGFPNRAVCFKPAESNGSRGFRVLDPLLDEQDLLFQQKPGSPYITGAEAIRILSAAPFPELLVSEYLPGDEYSVDALTQEGEAFLVVPRKRSRMINGISVEGVFEEQPPIIDYCRKIIGALKLTGNIGLQVKQSASGEFGLLEINPRLQGTTSAALGAGINFPVLGVKLALGQLPDAADCNVRWGTRFSRYWETICY